MSIFILLARVIDRIGAPLSKFKIDDTKSTTKMPYGAMLKIPDAATAIEDAKDGHQQQQPLWVYAPFGAPAAPAVPCKKAFRSRFTEGWAKGREQSRQNRQQNGRTSAVSCLTFQSALEEGLVIRNGRCPHRGNSAASANAPGIASDGVAARNGVDTVFDAPSQLTAETESSSGAEDWQGAGGCRSLHYKSEGLIWS